MAEQTVIVLSLPANISSPCWPIHAHRGRGSRCGVPAQIIFRFPCVFLVFSLYFPVPISINWLCFICKTDLRDTLTFSEKKTLGNMAENSTIDL